MSAVPPHGAGAEQTLKSKSKGIVERILQQCDQCGDDSAAAGDCTPAWFCYDCHQYLCTPCEQAVHKELRDHVSLC